MIELKQHEIEEVNGGFIAGVVAGAVIGGVGAWMAGAGGWEIAIATGLGALSGASFGIGSLVGGVGEAAWGVSGVSLGLSSNWAGSYQGTVSGKY
jgi:hypothetical protein